MGDVELIRAQDRNEVIVIDLYEEFYVVNLWVSEDLIEMAHNDFKTSFHHFGIFMLQGVQVQFGNWLFVEDLGDDQISQIIEKSLASESNTLGVKWVYIMLIDLFLNAFDVLHKINYICIWT